MAVKAPYFSLTGSHADVVRNFQPKVRMASQAPVSTTAKIPSRITATMAASKTVSCRKPLSTSFSLLGLRRSVKASDLESPVMQRLPQITVSQQILTASGAWSFKDGLTPPKRQVALALRRKA